MSRNQETEKKIKELVSEYFKEVTTLDMRPNNWKVPIGGGNYDDREVNAVISAYLHGLLSTQQPVRELEESFSSFIGLKYGIGVNSGTSANILALNAMMETGDLKPGDEVALPAMTYISVASPIIQLGLIPVYIDVEKETLNMDMDELEKALKEENKIKCVMIVHTLGIPADMDRLMGMAEKHDLKIIEDCCEAHGAEYKGKRVGSFGDIATWSFYVAHHMTTGDGGMVATNSKEYRDICVELREFGRDYSYEGERYGYNDDKLTDFDERYTFRRIGWNFRMSDAHAAFGLEQVKKLEGMNESRVKNVAYLTKKLSKFSDDLLLAPEPSEGFSPVLYSYPITLKDSSKSRKAFAHHMDDNGVENRAIMCGALPDQPALVGYGREVGDLKNSRFIRDNSFFVGCHPLLTEEDLDIVVDAVESFLKK